MRCFSRTGPRAGPGIKGSCLATALLAAIAFSSSPVSAQWLGSDEDFVDMVERKNFDFFPNNQGGDGTPHLFWGCSFHLQLDGGWGDPTIAGDGFGIASLCVGAYRGWISEEEAYNRILMLLQTYDTSLSRDGYNFYSHWNNFYTGAPSGGPDWSRIDTAWFIAGALVAAQYYKGTEVEEIANRIYETTRFYDGSLPEPFGFNPWSMGYCEYYILNVLGAGSPTYGYNHPWDTYNCWVTNIVPYHYGPLFWYQWPQHFIDFRYTVDGNGRNHYNEARTIMLEHRDRCIYLKNTEPSKYNDYGTNCWGLTAATASFGYHAMHPWSEYDSDSGTIVPVCLPACMSHVPYEARECMKYIYNTYGYTNVFGPGAFMNALNMGQAWDGDTHWHSSNASPDLGANVLAIENFRSGMPWKYFMSHPRVQVGLNLCGVVTAQWIPYHDDWNDGADTNAWGGNTSFVNTDGTDPTANYVDVTWYNEWVNGKARRLATTGSGSGDVVRIELNGTDQSKEDLLSFWLRGQDGGEQFDVGLRDAEGHEVRLSITNYVENGVVSTNWYRVRIPLRPYAVSGNANNDVRILWLGDINIRFRAAGTIDIDDLAFVDDDLSPPAPAFGAACLDGRVHMRWAYSAHDDVVGYHLWRRPDAGSGFDRLNASLLSAQHDELDVLVESEWGEDYFYAVQCLDRHGNAGPFSSGAYEQRVWIGRHRDLDWGDGLVPNTFGGDHGGWGAGWSTTFERRTGWDGATRWVRRVAAGGAGAGSYIALQDGSIAAYDAVSFWLRGESGGESFDVGLRSWDSAETKMPISRYVPGGTVTTNWVQVVVPLIDFKALDLTRMDNLSFTFLSAGAALVDEIRFVRRDQDGDIVLAREGEKANAFSGGSTNDFKWFASEAYTLGDSWAASAGQYAQFNFTAPSELNEAYLDTRYACGSSTGRPLQILVNSTPVTSVTLNATGGWGDQTNHFAEPSARLGRIAAGPFTLELRATNAGSPINLDRVVVRSATHYFREAEHYDAQSGSGGKDYKFGASGGETLGDSWGGANGSYAAYSNIVLAGDITNAVLRVRYGQDWDDGRVFRVRLDGTNMGRIACSFTHGWLTHWCQGNLAELPLGRVPAGTHTLRIEAESDDQPVNMDWVRIAGRMSDVRQHDVDGDGIPDAQEVLLGTPTNMPDADLDGLSDLYEMSKQGDHLTNPQDPDSDDDGMDDGEEDIAGTNPTNDTSLLETDVASDPADGSLLLSWPGSPGHNYSIEYLDQSLGLSNTFETATNPEDITFSPSAAEYRDDGTGTTPGPHDPAVRHRVYRVRAYRP